MRHRSIRTQSLRHLLLRLRRRCRQSKGPKRCCRRRRFHRLQWPMMCLRAAVPGVGVLFVCLTHAAVVAGGVPKVTMRKRMHDVNHTQNETTSRTGLMRTEFCGGAVVWARPCPLASALSPGPRVDTTRLRASGGTVSLIRDGIPSGLDARRVAAVPLADPTPSAYRTITMKAMLRLNVCAEIMQIMIRIRPRINKTH